jgi:hypothetical protein
MLLSNPQAAAVALSILIITAAGCSWLRNSEPVSLTPTIVAPPETGLPFETKEPEVYQADFVTAVAGSETRSHFARKDGKWRLDTYVGETMSRSIIQSDKLVYLDHKKKQYSESPVSAPDPQPQFIADLTTSLLSEQQPAKFEDLGAEGTLERYRVTVDGANATSTIIFDTANKMVVRYEIEGGFVFEMRNFTLKVDEAIFAIPTGYRKIAWTAFSQQ